MEPVPCVLGIENLIFGSSIRYCWALCINSNCQSSAQVTLEKAKVNFGS